MKKIALFGALLVLAVTACAGLDRPVMCTEEARFGVSVRVRDSVTGAAAASGAQLVIRDGTYADTVSYPPASTDLDRPLSGAIERAGVYTLTVSKAGYRDWIRSGVQVTEGKCHVNGVSLTALLQPSP